MAEKVYLKCSAKSRENNFGNTEIKLGIKADDLAEFVRTHKNERGYINLIISKRRETGQYGDTHSVYLDAYTRAGATPDAGFADRHNEPVDDSDCPF